MKRSGRKRLVPCARIKLTMVKSVIDPTAENRFSAHQFNGSLGESEGMGNRRVFPSEVIRKTEPCVAT